MKSNFYDVIVVGAGPGGSTTATLLAKQNLKVCLIEKEEFPRFKIGESLLPHSMDILKESGVFEKIDQGQYIRKYGASFIDHNEDKPVYFDFSNGLDNDHAYAFEVPREQFDKDLLEHAQSCGVEVLQPCQVKSIDVSDNPVKVVTSKAELSCQYVVDASGRSAVLGQQFKSRKKNDEFINNVAIFNHYKNVKRDVQEREGDIIIGILPENTWSWHIPFLGDVTSVGVVCAPEVYKKHKNEKDIVNTLLQCHPTFIDIMSEATTIKQQTVVSNYSYSSDKKIGDNWIMVGDAATFLDPVFSSGVHISLQSAQFAAKIITESIKQGTKLDQSESGKIYEQELDKGVKRFQSLLLLFYKTAFYKSMTKAIQTERIFRSFTAAISGDMWNESNILFRLGVLKDGKITNDHFSS